MDDGEGIVARLGSRDPEVVKQAAFDAADMARVDAVPSLLKLLEAGDLATMGAVAYALGELQAEQARPRLMELLKDARTAGRRGSLMYAMMCLDCKDHFHDMLAFLFDDSFEVRCKAAMILEATAGDMAVDALVASRSELAKRLREGAEEDDDRRAEVEAVLETLSEEIRRRESELEGE